MVGSNCSRLPNANQVILYSRTRQCFTFCHKLRWSAPLVERGRRDGRPLMERVLSRRSYWSLISADTAVIMDGWSPIILILTLSVWLSTPSKPPPA